MRSVEVQLLTDAVEFNDIAESWLSSDPFSTSILAGMLTGILSGARDQPAGTRWIVVLDDADVVGVAMHTPPYHPFLPRLPAAAAAAVASVLLATGQEFTGVTGEAAAVTAFADSWAARTGGTSSVAMSMRMYRLGMLTPPVGIPGHPRRVELSDIELVADWFDRFHTEANPHSPAEDATIAATRRIATDQMWVWERDERPVSLAVGTTPVAGVATIAPVYTPPEHRRCGYGAAVTSQATRACIDAGARHVILYTDLANPTSNSIYQQIGYLPDHEAQERQLHPAPPRRAQSALP
jgi:predicted GNAT family acetyltransferase